MENTIIISEDQANQIPLSSGAMFTGAESKELNNGTIKIIKDFEKDIYKTELCRHAKNIVADPLPQNNGFFTVTIPYVVEAGATEGYDVAYTCLHCILEAAKQYGLDKP